MSILGFTMALAFSAPAYATITITTGGVVSSPDAVMTFNGMPQLYHNYTYGEDGLTVQFQGTLFTSTVEGNFGALGPSWAPVAAMGYNTLQRDGGLGFHALSVSIGNTFQGNLDLYLRFWDGATMLGTTHLAGAAPYGSFVSFMMEASNGAQLTAVDICTTFPGGGSVFSACVFDKTLLDNVKIDFVGRAAIPEPATWALMITGFGLVGTTLRRRRVPAYA